MRRYLSAGIVAGGLVILLLGAGIMAILTDNGPQRQAVRTPSAVAPAGAGATTRTQQRDIYRTVRLDGTVEQYDPVPVTALRAGRFIPASASRKARTVTRGTRLGTIRSCVPDGTQEPSPATSTTKAPGGSGPQPAPTTGCRTTYTQVTAGAAGRVTPLREQDIETAAVITTIQPLGLRIRLPVTDPAVLYTFADPPKRGKAEIVGGPSGFTVHYDRRAYDRTSGQTTVWVRMPDDVTAFPGLSAVVVFVTDMRDNVSALPLSAVRGRSGSGQVVAVDARGSRTVTEVVLGASDEAYIEVTGIGPDTDILLYPLESDFDG